MIQLYLMGALLLTCALAIVILAAYLRSDGPALPRTLFIAILFCQFFSQLVLNAKFWGLAETHTFIFRLAFPFELSSMPLIYLYVVALTNPNFKPSDLKFFHAIPFVIGWGWYFGILFYGDEELFRISNRFLREKDFRTLIDLLISMPYLWFSLRALRRFQSTACQTVSDFSELRLPWLRFLLILCFSSAALALTDILGISDLPLWTVKPLWTVTGLLGFTYFGLSSSKFLTPSVRTATTTESPQVSPQELERLKLRLLEVLKSNKLYLQPQLRLATLAESLGVKSYILSEVINRGLGTNFYELINGLRIEHAKAMMLDPAASHLNLLGIAMDSGFNSKSTFNDTFRRTVGVTPSTFRQNLNHGANSP